MRQLLPPADDPVEPSIYLADGRPAPPGRPWVLVNMIATADGATEVGERSGPLGGPADKAVFHTLREAADVVLVGAGTVRAEGYGPARLRSDGTPGPRIAVVTRSGALDPAARLFTEPARGAAGPLVVTCEACPAERRAALAAAGAEVVVHGDDDVDLTAALAALRVDAGAGIVTCEGGPTLNGHLLAADLIDEWCLTMAPLLAAGGSFRAAVGPRLPGDGTAELRLDRLLEADGFLFARYLRPR